MIALVGLGAQRIKHSGYVCWDLSMRNTRHTVLATQPGGGSVVELGNPGTTTLGKVERG